MIAIDIRNGFALYVLIMMGALCVVALREAWRARVQSWHVSEEQLARCPDCSCTFVVHRSETIARCPRCHRLCQMSRK